MTIIGKPDLIAHIAFSSGVDKETVKKVFDASLESIKVALQTGQEVRLIGFGNFAVQKLKERPGFNFQTNTKVTVPASLMIRFKVSEELKDRIKKGSSRSRKTTPKKITVQATTEKEAPKADKTEKKKTLPKKQKPKTS